MYGKLRDTARKDIEKSYFDGETSCKMDYSRFVFARSQ